MRILLLFLMGASIGSFLGLVIDRFPHTSIVFPASHCNHCKKQLKAWHLIPVFSQLYHHSRCAYCQKKIPIWYGVFETICGILCLLVGNGILSFSTYLVLLCGLTLAVYDIKHKEYPILVWLAFLVGILFCTGFSSLFFVFFTLAVLAQLLPLKIGSGDFLYLALIALSLNLVDLLWIIQISSLFGILFILLTKKQSQTIPFIPFLLLALVIYFPLANFLS
ncbi:prepilin peptidase [Streptococcus cameli]